MINDYINLVLFTFPAWSLYKDLYDSIVDPAIFPLCHCSNMSRGFITVDIDCKLLSANLLIFVINHMV